MPGAPLDLERVAAALRSVLPRGLESIALHEPRFGERERRQLEACLASGWVSTAGPAAEGFERELARAAGVAHAVATSSGTAALHVALLLAGVRPGDEVLLPALSFVASANAVHYCGATPHFADVNPETLCLDPGALEARLRQIAEIRAGACRNRESGRPIRAALAVHALGHPPALDALRALADRWQLELVDDAAAALGSTYRGRPACAGARLAIVSFNGNKILTAGGGGAILTCDEALARRARHLVRTARRSAGGQFTHDEVGFNYAMPGLNAALGSAQLARLPRLVELKRALAQAYDAALRSIAGAQLLRESPDVRSNYWLCAIALRDPGALPPLARRLAEHGISTRPLWSPLHTLPMYRDAPRGPLEQSESLAPRVLCLPSSAFLAEAGASRCTRLPLTDPTARARA